MSRIIAGSAKGRSLETPKGRATRPTSDRVREALFTMLSSWLGTVDDAPEEHLAGIAFLDLYSGSGAVALEAASRGAGRVVAVEKDPPTARLIGENSKLLDLPVDVRPASVPTFASEPGERFDIVYIDPPYDIPAEALDDVVASLVARDRLAPRALVILERSKRSSPPEWPDVFEETWDRRYGETMLHLGVTRGEEDE